MREENILLLAEHVFERNVILVGNILFPVLEIWTQFGHGCSITAL